MTHLEQLSSFRSLLQAFRRAFLGNRTRPEACRFHLELEERLLELQRALRQGRYRPDPYRYFTIRHPKPRLISVASFRDRVVHHALVHELEPIWECRFIKESYACRKGKGTLRALHQARRWARGHRYYAQTDITSYFASVHHPTLLARLADATPEPDLLALCARLVGNARLPTVPPGEARGLPIGNLTSQFWANVYLDPLDHHARDVLHLGAYSRYMDDLLLFGDSKAELWEALAELREFAEQRLGLRFKERATRVAPTDEGLSYLGWRVFPGMLRLGHVAAARLATRLRRAARRHRQGRWDGERVARSMTSLCALASLGATRTFRDHVLRELAEPEPDRP